MQRTSVAVTLAAALLAGGCAVNSQLLFRSDTNFEFRKVRFRLPAAYEAFLGSVGLKRTEGKNRYELKFIPEWRGLSVQSATKFDLELKQAISRSFGVKGEAGSSGKGDFNLRTSLDSKESGKYHLLRIVDTKSLVDQLNDPRNQPLCDYIRRSKDYRIVTSVIVVYDHAASEKIEKGANVGLSLNAEAGKASISVKRDDAQGLDISMSDGTIFAYEFSRICWEAGRNGRPRVADILLDRDVKKSDAGACLSGTDSDPRRFGEAQTSP